jgi:flavin-dependent dehydrogenase
MVTGEHVDVVIIGGGLAGLSLARHLLLETDKCILLLDRKRELPPTQQKVGESTVQLAGYYFSKVLDMEEHLLCEHFMKYNLRFHWKVAGCENNCFEHYAQTYLRTVSNVASYQLDRNAFEAELFRRNALNARFRFRGGVQGLRVSLAEDAAHEVRFELDNQEFTTTASWVVDTSGRGKLLARDMQLAEPSVVQHDAAFLWVDGFLNLEKLTDRSPREVRLSQTRQATGHLPQWLATNHFMGEGFWFWVIPLQGKTSLGLVYDRRRVARDAVSSAEKLIQWACREFPLFARDLPNRKILHYGAMRDFSYGCQKTIDESRWAISGDAGRFADPLYSPGSDFIAIHNTLIVAAIRTTDARLRKRQCWFYELVMQSLYHSLLPTFSISYDALGNQETMILKYTWELSIYFTFFVFPFLNDLHADIEFIPGYLSRLSRLGKVNASLQRFLNDYYHWKARTQEAMQKPQFYELMSLAPLRRAEQSFYQIGLTPAEAHAVLDEQMSSLLELARYIAAHIHAIVLDEPELVSRRAFVEGLDLRNLCFDVDAMRQHAARHSGSLDAYAWTFDTTVLDCFSPSAAMQCREHGAMEALDAMAPADMASEGAE